MSSSLPFQFFTDEQLTRIKIWQNIIVFCCQCLTLLLLGNLLCFTLFRPKTVRMGSIMRLFLALHFVCTLSALPASIQKVFFPIEYAVRNVTILFFISSIHAVYNLSVGSFFTFFLTVERIFVLKFTVYKIRQYSFSIALAMSICLYCISFGFFLAELPFLDREKDSFSYLQSFVQHLQNNGVQLYAISVQNEPDIHVSYESMEWTPQQMVDFLRSQGSRISGTKLMAAESFQFRKDITDAILNDATAASKVSIIAGHIYGGGLGNYVLAKQKGKDVWMTEHYLDGDSWQMCMQTAKEIHDSMTMAEYNAYLTWWFKDANPNDQDRSIGPIDGNGNPTILGYVLGQWAKFVRPNSVRIDATPNPSSNVFVSAYKSGNQVVIVAVNMGGWTSQQFSISGGSVPSSFTPFVTSNNKRISTEATVSVSGGSFTFNLEAQSVTTFVSSGTNPNPDPNPNPNPNPATTKATTKQPSGGGGGSASATASVAVGSTWNGGGQFRVVIKNTGSKPLCKVVFKLSLASGQTINSIWNADAQSGGQYSTPGWVNIGVGATSQDTGFVVSGSSATPNVSVLSANAC